MLLTSLFEKRSDVIDPVHPGDPALSKFFRFMGLRSDTGVAVDAESAPETVAVMACVRVIAETIASLPLILYQWDGEDDRKRASSHRLYNILRYQPNNYQTWYEFAEMMTGHACLRHGGCAEIIIGADGNVQQLIPLHPDCVTPFLFKGKRYFRYQPFDGPARTLLPGEMLYLPAMSQDGVKGIDPITYARHAIGLARATEQYGGRFFANDARPGIAISHPTSLGDVAYGRLKDWVESRHKGLANAHKTAILEEGMKIEKIGVDPENAQFLETRKFQKAEIAGFFRVPPHLIGDLDKATFSNIEHQSRQFIDYTMLPWFTRWEQAIRRDLFTNAEKEKYFAEFLPDALLRGDILSRYQAYATGRSWGFMSANDVRRRENMNKIADGDIYLQPMNTVKAGDIPHDYTKNKPADKKEDQDEE